MNNTASLLSLVKLRFNIEHPTLEDCYAYGYECVRAGVHEDSNPYEKCSNESNQWLEGWWDGFYGEKPLHELDGITEEDLSVDEVPAAANDHEYYEGISDFFTKVLEITSVIVVSAFVGYQLIELVA